MNNLIEQIKEQNTYMALNRCVVAGNGCYDNGVMVIKDKLAKRQWYDLYTVLEVLGELG